MCKALDRKCKQAVRDSSTAEPGVTCIASNCIFRPILPSTKRISPVVGFESCFRYNMSDLKVRQADETAGTETAGRIQMAHHA